MATFDQVLRLAQQLPSEDQARLREALLQAEAAAHAAQIARNRGAIAMLDAWSAGQEEDDGNVTWDEMLQALDQHRESTRILYPDLHPGTTERNS